MDESFSLVGDPLWTAGGASVSCGLVEDKATMTEQEMTGQKTAASFTALVLGSNDWEMHALLTTQAPPPLLRIPGHSKIGPHLQLSIKGVVELVEAGVGGRGERGKGVG